MVTILLLLNTFLEILTLSLLLPILTRFFSPTDFGVLAVYMAIVQLLAISLTFRLEMAVVLPKKDLDAALLQFPHKLLFERQMIGHLTRNKED